MKMRMNGGQMHMKDSIRKPSITEIKKENSDTPTGVAPINKNRLKRQINVLERVTAEEWLKKHTKQNGLLLENILTGSINYSIMEI